MKLSIITINYNNAIGLEKTVDSVIKQTWKNFEYIIIDGGSNDRSKSIIELNKKNIDYWVSESDKGIFNAMNKGLKVAKGEYILMLNSGDYLIDENSLNLVFSQNHENADLIYGNVFREADGKIHDKSIFPEKLDLDFFIEGMISHQAVFIKNELHKNIGYYNENLKYCADWEFITLAICKYDSSYKNINEFIAICNSEGLSCNPKFFKKAWIERSQSLMKHFPDLELPERKFNFRESYLYFLLKELFRK